MWKQSQNQNRKDQYASGTGNECPVCHGTGWELYEEAVLGYSTVPIPYARECRRCAQKRRAFDATGTPREFYSAQYTQFDFGIYKSAGMDKMKELCDSFVYEFGKNWEAEGKGLYLWSAAPGSGKTFLACCIAKTVMMKNDAQLRFVTEPDYLVSVQEGYKRDRGLPDPSEIYRKCRLLVLDDLGTQKDSEWVQQEMFRLINWRTDNRLVTIYTSNFDPASLKFNDRTKSRLRKSSITLHMPEESIRQRKADEEQARFIERILQKAI